MTRLTSQFAVAWMLALAPVVLFIPAFMLAGMGPCTFSHPWVIVAAFLLFIVLELAALPCFVKAARSAGKVLGAMIGMGLAILLLLLSVALEYYTVADYWADVKLGL
jgi:hypothetical protein